MRLQLSIAICIGLLGAAASASASSVTCNTYTTSNGTTTFPGTYVGTVGNASGQTCQIGNLSIYNGGTGGAFVSVASNPSIYEFYWAGGSLGITEKIGNNGTGDAIDAELDSLASQASVSANSTLASVQIPFSSGPSSTYTLYSGPLDAGYYAIDTYLATGNVTDPNYQINFAPIAPTPEPSGLVLLGSGALALGAQLRRRMQASRKR